MREIEKPSTGATNEPPASDGASDYRSISCELHDRLEDIATLRKRVRVRYREESGALQQRQAVIVDVFARHGAEYLSLDSGETVRLDLLEEVDGMQFMVKR